MKAFMVKDLMINVVPARIGAGGAGMPGPDDDIDDFPPTITPVIMVAKYSPRFEFLGKFEGKIDLLDAEILNNVALEVGQLAVAGMFIGAAQCTQDMPTCPDNPWLSRFATGTDTLRFEDLIAVKVLLNEAVGRIDEIADARLDLARANAKELLPKFEAAIQELKEFG